MSLTIRQNLARLLSRGPASAAYLADALLLTPAEVEGHLEHLKKSLGKNFRMAPAECRDCGFVFRKRSRLDAPGRCPACKSQRVDGPWFQTSVRESPAR